MTISIAILSMAADKCHFMVLAGCVFGATEACLHMLIRGETIAGLRESSNWGPWH